MASVGHRDSFLNNIIPLCVFLLIIMISASSSKAISNVLTTGQTLSSKSRLSYANSNVSLVLTYNWGCGLICGCALYLVDGKGYARWLYHSRRIRKPPKIPGCTLPLTDNGRLVLTNNYLGEHLWSSSNDKSRVGKYIAILRPESELVIYGPAIWAVGEPQVKESSISIISSSGDMNINEIVFPMTNLKNRPTIHNVLFSGQKLHNGDKISENGYNFILDDCELILKDSHGKNSWQTGSHGNGTNCYARLDNFGGLSIFDGDEKHDLVWKNDLALPPSFPSEYALVMQSNGTATIYGPKVWSSKWDNPSDILIKMDTVEM